jgi:HSP20 family protein
MTLVKFNGVPFERNFSSLVDNFLTEVPELLKNNAGFPKFTGHTPVNITEKEDTFEISVAAPGYEKPDFKINLEYNLLTIAAERKNEESKEGIKSIRKEFHLRSFKRTFTIDSKIDTEKVEARYVNGILNVTLYKKEEAKATSKDIEIQ